MGKLEKFIVMPDFAMDYWTSKGCTSSQVWKARFEADRIWLNESLKETFSRHGYTSRTRLEIFEGLLDEVQ